MESPPPLVLRFAGTAAAGFPDGYSRTVAEVRVFSLMP